MTETEQRRIKLLKREFLELMESEIDLTREDFERFFNKQYQEYLIDRSQYLKLSGQILSKEARLDFDGNRMSQNPQSRYIRLSSELYKLEQKMSEKESELVGLSEQFKEKKVKEISRLSKIKEEKLKQIAELDFSDRNYEIETAGITLTEETFIQKKLFDLPKDFSEVNNSLLFQAISNYQNFLQHKLINQNGVSRSGVKKKSLENTHRVYALVERYKANGGLIPKSFNGAEIEREFGAKRKQAYYSTWGHGINVKPATIKELEAVITLLEQWPLIQKAAINDLDQLR